MESINVTVNCRTTGLTINWNFNVTNLAYFWRCFFLYLTHLEISSLNDTELNWCDSRMFFYDLWYCSTVFDATYDAIRVLRRGWNLVQWNSKTLCISRYYHFKFAFVSGLPAFEFWISRNNPFLGTFWKLNVHNCGIVNLMLLASSCPVKTTNTQSHVIHTLASARKFYDWSVLPVRWTLLITGKWP